MRLFDKVICLTLPRLQERQLRVAAELEAVGLGHFEFFAGVGAGDEAVRRCYAEGRVQRYPPCFRCGKMDCGDPDCNNVLIAPQVAVVVGFQRIMRYVSGSADTAVAMILEDDAVFARRAAGVFASPEFADLIEASGIRSDVPTLIRMAAPSPDPARFAEPGPPEPLRLERSVVMSNYCFLVNRPFAEIAAGRLETIDHTADMIIHAELGQQLNGWTLADPLVSDRSWWLGEVSSLIHPKRHHLEHLARTSGTATAEYQAETRRLARHRKKVLEKDYGIIGSPCCGGQYVSAYLRQHGFDIRHEALGKHGICAWQLAVSDSSYPCIDDAAAESDEFLYFHHWLLYTRRPLDAIASLVIENRKVPASYDFRRRHILARYGVDLDAVTDGIERAVLAYCYWHLLALERKPEAILHVEQLPAACGAYFRGTQFLEPKLTVADLGVGTRYLGIVCSPEPLEPGWQDALSPAAVRLLGEVSGALGYDY
jgi:hypothetical protein